MYLPRTLISHLYTNLLRTHHPLSPPVLIFVALEPDALCACRILTSLLKRDYIPHKIQAVAGYGELVRAGEALVKPMRLGDGGSGGVVVCLGVGGLVDLETIFKLDAESEGSGGFDGVEIWVLDERRPWSLSNIFGGQSSPPSDASTRPDEASKNGVDRGQITRDYKPGKGGLIVFDDGDIEQDLSAERDAWYALADMPEVDDDEESLPDSEGGSENDVIDSQSSPSRKRKSWLDDDEDDNESEKENRPSQRRRSNSSSSIHSTPASGRQNRAARTNIARTGILGSTPPSNQQSSPSGEPQPSARELKRRLLRMRRKHVAIIRAYSALGTSYSEPISSLMYSLASELGREDNDLLWLAIVGVSSTELYGRTQTGVSLTNHDLPTSFNSWSSSRGARIRQILRDEVKRLNPPELGEIGREGNIGYATDVIPTNGRSPTDTSIRLSPEPRFLLVRHWSLYDSMLHSPYLSAKLHIWSDAGRRRLHKLLAKMGVSLTQCKQSYTHMDMELKKVLREKLLHFAPMYGLDGLVPTPPSAGSRGGDSRDGWGFVRTWGWKACLSAADVAVVIGAILEVGQQHLTLTTSTDGDPSVNRSTSAPAASNAEGGEVGKVEDTTVTRFYSAYDALLSPSSLLAAIPQAQYLHRAILRTGTSLLQKRQLRHLRAFRMAIVKEGPDVALFTHPGALTKLALWVGEAIGEVEGGNGKDGTIKYGGTPLVLGCIDEIKGIYLVVGVGGGGAGKDPIIEEEKKKRKEEKEKRSRERQENREAKRRKREEHMAANGLEDDEVETEEEDSESASDSSSDDEDGAGTNEDGERRKKARRNNRFGNAFQEVIEETNARVRLDSFEHCVVEVRKEDLSGFLESLSMKAVVG